MITKIDEVSNYYGILSVKKDGDKFFWGIKDWDGDYGWVEIPESLYAEVLKRSNGV